MGRVFISYRRDDSAGHAMWLRDFLQKRVGADNVFFDRDTIAPGLDFVEAINDALDSCHSMLVLIGPRWADEAGRRRLDEPADYVRLEVEVALGRRIQVLPILVNRATMPTEADLPEVLRPLCRHNAVEFDDNRREHDLRRIFNILGLPLAPPRPDAGLPFCDACQKATIASAKFCPTCGGSVSRRPGRDGADPDERRLVTLLSATIEIPEQLEGLLPAEHLTFLQAECVEAGRRRIEAYGGRAEAVTESEIFASFGRNAANEDDAERAARAALDLRDLVNEKARALDLEDAGGPCLRIGVHSGWTTADVEQQPADLVSGDAAALRRLAGPGTILVGESTAGCLGDRFRLDLELSLPDPADGRPRAAWRLLGHKDGTPGARRAPLIGRQEEMATVRRCLDDLCVGQGHILGVSGEQGAGVSRVLEELQATPAPEVVWLHGRCPSYGKAMQYVPFVEALRNHLGIAGGEADIRVRFRLRSRLEALLGQQSATVFPYLGWLLGLAPSSETEERVSHLDPEQRKAGVHDAYLTFVEALSLTAPVGLVIEDLHWADPSTGELASALLPLTRHAQVLLVAGFRPEIDSEAWCLRLEVQDDYPPPHFSTEVRLQPLAPEETRALAQSLMPGQPAAVLDAIVERAEGNPLYVDILLQGLREFGALEATSEPRRTSGSLPPALESVLFARIDRLPPAPRRAAQAAAVIGRTFLGRILEQVTEQSALRDELDVLGARNVARLLRRIPESEYSFTHGLLQEALLTTLGPDRRRTVHGQVAGVIEDLFADGLDKHAALLAYHYAESDNREKALEYCERAGQEAFAIHANRQAVEWWTKTLDLAADLGEGDVQRRVMHKLADLLVLMGQLDRATAYYRELAATAITEDEAVIVLADAAWAMVMKDAYEEAAALIDKAETLTAETAHARAAVKMARARAAWSEHRIDHMGSILEEMEQEPLDELPTEAMLRRMELWVTYLDKLGDRERAGVWEERMLQLAQERDDPQLLLAAERNAGITKLDAGDLEAARALLTRCCAAAEQLGFVNDLIIAGVNSLYLMYLQGDVPAGVALAQDLEPIVTLPRWRAMYRAHWGFLELEGGRPAEARTQLRIALETAQVLDSRHLVAQAAIALARADVMLGAGVGEAEAAITGALAAAEVGDQLHGQRWLAEIALQQGQPALASAQAEEALTLPVSDCEKVPLWRVRGAAREALLPGSGRGDIERALAVARDTGRRLEEARALLQLSELADTPEPLRCLEQARAIFDEKGVPLQVGAAAAPPSAI